MGSRTFFMTMDAFYCALTLPTQMNPQTNVSSATLPAPYAKIPPPIALVVLLLSFWFIVPRHVKANASMENTIQLDHTYVILVMHSVKLVVIMLPIA